MANQALILLGGTFGGVALIFLVFRYCFDSIFSKIQSQRHNPSVYYEPKIVGRRRFRPEVERFVHEEFDSPFHDIIFITMSNSSSCIGICAFRQDRKIEYFLEKFPQCCENSSHEDSQNGSSVFKCQDKVRAGLAALSYWGVKFTLADHVHMLSDDRTFVEMANANGSSLVKEKINQYEKQFDFTLMCQWTDNYIVDMAANDELWEGLIASGKRLMESNDANNYSIWRDFPCEEWERQRIVLESENFHQLPHAGEVSDDDSKPLVDI